MRKTVSKVLSVMAVIVLLMTMLPVTVGAEFKYKEAEITLDVGASSGVFEVTGFQKGTDGTKVDFSKEQLKDTYTEPGVYKYTLKATEATGSNYKLTVVIDSKDDKLVLSDLFLQREGSDKKINKMTQFQILLRKVSSAKKDIVLKGAIFELYTPDAVDEKGELKTEPAPTPLMTVETGEDGMADLGFLEPGIYYLREAKAPKDYKRNTTIWKLEVNEQLPTDPEGKNVIFLNDTRVKLNEDGSSATISIANTPIPDGLPQTGQLWWPIVPLTTVGALMIVLGFIMKRRGQWTKN